MQEEAILMFFGKKKGSENQMILIGIGKNGGKVHKAVGQHSGGSKYNEYGAQCEVPLFRFFTTNGEENEVTCVFCKDNKSLMTYKKIGK